MKHANTFYTYLNLNVDDFTSQPAIENIVRSTDVPQEHLFVRRDNVDRWENLVWDQALLIEGTPITVGGEPVRPAGMTVGSEHKNDLNHYYCSKGGMSAAVAIHSYYHGWQHLWGILLFFLFYWSLLCFFLSFHFFGPSFLFHLFFFDRIFFSLFL